MHSCGSKRALELRPITTPPALNFGKLRNDPPLATVEVLSDCLSLSRHSKPGASLLARRYPIVSDKSPCEAI
jgi:hypothetical protein